MLKTFRKGILTAAAAVLGAALLGGCGSGTRASDGLVHLNFRFGTMPREAVWKQ